MGRSGGIVAATYTAIMPQPPTCRNLTPCAQLIQIARWGFQIQSSLPKHQSCMIWMSVRFGHSQRDTDHTIANFPDRLLRHARTQSCLRTLCLSLIRTCLCIWRMHLRAAPLPFHQRCIGATESSPEKPDCGAACSGLWNQKFLQCTKCSQVMRLQFPE